MIELKLFAMRAWLWCSNAWRWIKNAAPWKAFFLSWVLQWVVLWMFYTGVYMVFGVRIHQPFSFIIDVATFMFIYTALVRRLYPGRY